MQGKLNLKVENNRMNNVIETKSFDFAVRIVNLYKHLTALLIKKIVFL